MTPDADEARLAEYLLGRLDEDEQTRIEERYFGDPGFHDRLDAVERDLIDGYLRGELADRGAFERAYLSSPARLSRVDFARSLMAWAEQPGAASVDSSSRRVPFRHFLGDPTRAWRMAAMVTVVVAASLFALSRWTPSPGNETSRIVAPPPSAVPALPDKPGSEPQTRVPPATLLLDANAVRGSGSMPTLVFDANAEVRLQLALETAGYPSYRVVVRTVAGEEIWRREGVTVIQSPSGPTLTITVPANRLADDDYTVRVGGISATGEVDEVSGYTFRAQAGR